VAGALQEVQEGAALEPERVVQEVLEQAAQAQEMGPV